MTHYRLSGQAFYFSGPVSELTPYEMAEKEPSAARPLTVPSPMVLSCQTVGLVGGKQREVETWSAPPGILLKVTGGSDFYISPGGKAIVPVEQNHAASSWPMTGLDREILLGPALVLALAMRGVWSLHASAIVFDHRLMAFLGESGQGKSTLAAYLASEGRPRWQLVADDILPVVPAAERVDAKPHFPQLKLPMDAQPGRHLSESLTLGSVCTLAQAGPDSQSGLQLLPPNQAVQALIRSTAGTRLFDLDLLSTHLAFCARAAGQVPVYQLTYPHRRDTLPAIMELLESL